MSHSNTHTPKLSVAVGVLAISALLFGGCSSSGPNPQAIIGKATAHWNVGNAAEAYNQAKTLPPIEEDDKDRMCFYLERGTFAITAGNAPAAAFDFQSAENVIGTIESGPVYSISEMIGSTYTGTNTERIMLGVMHGFALMEAGDFNNAGAMFNKTNAYQNEAYAKYADVIRKEAAKNAKMSNQKEGKIDTGIAKKLLPKEALAPVPGGTVPGFNAKNAARFLSASQLASIKAAREKNSTAAGVYTNPYAYWLSGIFALRTAEDANDRAKAAKLLEKAVATNGANSSLMLTDFLEAERAADGHAIKPATYIIYESGAIANRSYKDYVIHTAFISAYIQAICRTKGVKLGRTPLPNMTVRIPLIQPRKSAPRPPSIPGAKFETLVNLDAMKIAEFNQSRSQEITYNIIKASIACAVRFVAQEVAAAAVQKAGGGAPALGGKKAAKAGKAGGKLGKLGGKGTQKAATGALAGAAIAASASIPTPAFPVEMREWKSLPQKIYAAKISTPRSGTLKIGNRTVMLSKTGSNIVRIRNVAGTPLISVVSFEQ